MMGGLVILFSTEIGEKRGNVQVLTFPAQFLGTAWEYLFRFYTMKISIHSPFFWYTLDTKVKCVRCSRRENSRPVKTGLAAESENLWSRLAESGEGTPIPCSLIRFTLIQHTQTDNQQKDERTIFIIIVNIRRLKQWLRQQ